MDRGNRRHCVPLLRQIAGVILCCFVVAANAANLIGMPPVERFVPDLGTYPQNFAIVQDSRGIVYVGNTHGVMIFDGERWTLTNIDNREIVRSLAVDDADRVYVGGYDAFGFLQDDINGQSRYVDLTSRFFGKDRKPEFADVWDVEVTPEGVYFRALRDLYFWDPVSDQTRHWDYAGRFGALIHIDGQTILQFRGEGFRRRSGDDWIALPETSSVVDLISVLIPMPDGGVLMLGRVDGWRKLQDGRILPISMPGTLPAPAEFERGLRLRDGSIVLARRDGVVHIVNADRQAERQLQIDPGFISGLCQSLQDGFLVSGNLAIYRVAWPAPWTVLTADHGAKGSLRNVAHWQGRDYLLTSASALEILTRNGGLPTLEDTAWGTGGFYDLIPIDQARALLAGSHRLRLLSPGKDELVAENLLYPRMFQRSRFHAQRIYIGTEVGLAFMDNQDGDLKFTVPPSPYNTMRVGSLAETSETELWFGTARDGIWRVHEDASGFTQHEKLGESTGLRYGPIQEGQVIRLKDGAIYASTHHGFFKWTDQKFVADDFHGLAARRRPEELLRIWESSSGELWAHGIGNLLRHSRQTQWQVQPIQQIGRGAIERIQLDAPLPMVVASQALLIPSADVSTDTATTTATKVILRSAALVKSDGSRTPLPLHPNRAIQIPYSGDGISFQFALPELAQSSGRLYQGRLSGYEEEFSAWSRTRGYTYSRLSPGTYALEVRARGLDGIESAIEPYRLIILPPWYRSWWAWTIWWLLALLLTALATRQLISRRTARLAAEKLLLEKTVSERTRDLAAANKRLEAMAHLDGLTGIANRRRLDEYLDHVWRERDATNRHVGLLVIDVDHFKRFNDSHGHLEGDRLLQRLVTRLRQYLRPEIDLLARYGGEEFCIVLPDIDAESAAGMAHALRLDIDKAALGATVSIGVACMHPNGDMVSTLLNAADQALYVAKGKGRNRVEVSTDCAVIGRPPR